MQYKSHREYIRNWKNEYKKIKYAECPAFDNEKVLFTIAGFNHLIRKGRKFREQDEQTKRMTMICLAPIILKSSKKYITFFKSEENNKPVAYFWSFTSMIQGKKITVIVRQIGSNPKHFFSIFQCSAKAP